MAKHALFLIFAFFCVSTFAVSSLQEAFDRAVLSKGKTLKLEPITYFLDEPLVLSNKHCGLTVLGDPSGKTVISSARKIANWRNVGGGIWKAKVGGDVSSLYVNSRRARFSEIPNGDYFFIKEKVPSRERGGSSSEFIADKNDVLPLLNLPKSELKNARIDAYMSWIHLWLKIESLSQEGLDGESVLLKFLSPASCRPFFIYDKNPRYKILNTRAGLDEEGEFYFDAASREVFYKTYSEISDAFYPALETLLVGCGDSAENKLKNVKFENVSFECGGVKALENGAWQTSAQGATSFPSLVKFENAENIEFNFCIFRRAGGYAIEFGKSVWDSKIRNCIMHDLGAGGARLGVMQKAASGTNPELDGLTSGRIEVANNLIFNYGRECKSGIGILAFDVNSCKISNNEIFDGYYTGISVGWTWGSAPTHTQNNKINFNKIHHLSFGEMSDLGGIYTLGSSDGSEIAGNVISDITCHNYGGWGIYNDEGSSGFSVRKNFVIRAQEGGYFMHYGSNCAVENNLFADSKDFQVGLGRHNKNSFSFKKNLVLFGEKSPLFRGNPPKREDAEFDFNVYWRRGFPLGFGGMDFGAWQKSGQDKNSLVAKFSVSDVITGRIKNGGAVQKIGFEKLEISKAGPQGLMRRIAEGILKNYEFPKVANRAKSANFARYVDDDFSREVLNEKPMLKMEFIGERARVLNDASLGRILEVSDEKTTPSWMPYFFYRCNFTKPQTVKISFKMKLSENSDFIFELRENEGVLNRGAKFQIKDAVFMPTNAKLPIGEWLDIEMFLEVNGDYACFIHALNISNSNGRKLVNTSISINSETPSKTFGWMGFIFTGDGGAKTQFANFKILPNE